MERHLQVCNGLVWPVGVFDLVQLGLREGVVEVLDGHLVEGDHILELGQLRADRPTNENMFFNQPTSDCVAASDTVQMARCHTTELLPVQTGSVIVPYEE